MKNDNLNVNYISDNGTLVNYNTIRCSENIQYLTPPGSSSPLSLAEQIKNSVFIIDSKIIPTQNMPDKSDK